MPKLTKNDRAQHHARLSDWQTPSDMRNYVNGVMDGMGSTDFFKQGGVEFLRDAWLAAKFGMYLSSAYVRLVPERDGWPDFELQSGTADATHEGFECVEADMPDRKRGDEYKNEQVPKSDPVENWETRAYAIPGVLKEAVARKVAKNYPKNAVSLLIYLNINTYGIRQSEIESSMENNIAPAMLNFKQVWVLWNGHFYGPWNA